MSSLWYASSGKPYNEAEPGFFDSREHTWATDIEEHWNEIKGEVQKFIDTHDKSFTSNAERYKGLEKAEWSSLTFSFWGIKVKGGLEKECPTLAGYLNKIPGLVSISFSRLAPYSVIAEHRGDTNAAFRCHLGIEVPEGRPNCGFMVSGEQRAWQEGKWLFFNDAQRHSAWNKTDKRRILLILDVIRPEFLHQQKTICARLIARHSINNKPYLEKLPKPLKNIVFNLTAIAIRLYMLF